MEEKYELSDSKIQDIDDSFFEHFTALQYKLENKRLQLVRESGSVGSLDQSRSPRASPRHSKVDIKFTDLTKLDKKDIDLLYVEALYTIRHKIGGKNAAHSTVPVQELYEYVKQAFNVPEAKHEQFIQRANEEKPPVVTLNIVLIEARDLVAKDADGFSDPYSMLGIIPTVTSNEQNSSDSRKDRTPTQSPKSEEDKSYFDRTFSKHFGSKKAKKLTATKSESVRAKYIKVSSVKPNTLNPTWNETFKFDIDDVVNDKFHLDIWDHDDEESVSEAVKKLNEVSGFKGLGRYFKQVAQSARADDDDSNVDDFLGCLTLELKNMPSTAVQKWYRLDGRSDSSGKIISRGSIHLKAWLGTREDRPGCADEDEWTEVMQHEALIRIFGENELRRYAKEPMKWTGHLPQTAQSILHQHAIQGDITEAEEYLCYWLAYSKIHLGIGLDYFFLNRLLEQINKVWKPLSLSKQEEEMLADSFNQYLCHCYQQIIDHRDCFAVFSKTACKQLEEMLSTLITLHKMPLFKRILPFQRELLPEVTSLIKKSSMYFYEKCKQSFLNDDKSDNDILNELSLLVTKLNSACNDSWFFYQPIFEKKECDKYFAIIYKEWERQLANDLKIAHSDTEDNQKRLLQIFELYLGLSEFMEYRYKLSPKDQGHAPVMGLESWFEGALRSWLKMAKDKCTHRIDLALQMDKPIPPTKDCEFKQSTSYVDVCYCLQQICEFWDHVNMPDLNKKAQFIAHVIGDICSLATHYADKVFASLAHSGYYDEHAVIDQTAIETLCAAVNNVEHVRRLVKDVPLALHTTAVTKKLESLKLEETDSETKEATDPTTFNEDIAKVITSFNDETCGHIAMALDKLTDKQRDKLTKHVFHLAWSPTNQPAEDAVKPLIDYLDKQLLHYHRWLLGENFSKLLHSQCRSVLLEMEKLMNDNEGGESPFFRKLYEALDILVEFFHAGGKGVPVSEINSDPVFKQVQNILKLNKLNTFELIDRYYYEQLRIQESAADAKYGTLNIRAYFNPDTHLIVVDVVSAREILPLDSNGLSDPFVIIEMVPGYLYPEVKIKKTKCVYKTLNPDFNETFEFQFVPPTKAKPGQVQLGMLHFIVMDYDFMSANDFAGDAYLPLVEIPGVEGGRSSGERGIVQTALTLMHADPLEPPSPCSVLASRKEEREAQEFIRHLTTVNNA